MVCISFALIVKGKVAQSCRTLCDPMDYGVHGILQARILEWVAFPVSRGSSQPGNQTPCHFCQNNKGKFAERATLSIFFSVKKRETHKVETFMSPPHYFSYFQCGGV